MKYIISIICLSLCSFAFCNEVNYNLANVDPVSDSTSISLEVKQKDPDPLVLVTPNTFLDQDEADWQELYDKMNSTNAKNIILQVQGFGGDIIYGNKLINTIRNVQQHNKHVTVDLIGPAISMHAMVSCYADCITFEDGGSLLFHPGGNYHSLVFGYVSWEDYSLTPAEEVLVRSMLMQCRAKGILNSAQIYNILNQSGAYLIWKHNNRLYSERIADPMGVHVIADTIIALIITILLIGFVLWFFRVIWKNA